MFGLLIQEVLDFRSSEVHNFTCVESEQPPQGWRPSTRCPEGVKMSKTLKPGTPAPRSGQYRNPGTGTEVTGVRGKPLPPTPPPWPGLHVGRPDEAQTLRWRAPPSSRCVGRRLQVFGRWCRPTRRKVTSNMYRDLTPQPVRRSFSDRASARFFYLVDAIARAHEPTRSNWMPLSRRTKALANFS